MKKPESIFRKENGYYLIEVRLPNLNHFFDTLDPAPFRDKDIDADVEEYIYDSVNMFHLKAKLKMIFYLPQEHHLQASKVLAHAIDNHFDFQASLASKELRSTLHEGRVSFVFAFVFLFACMTARTALEFLAGHPVGDFLIEGLSIIGWVAMWRPVHIFLYDWWALYRKIKIHEKIRDMPLDVTLDIK